MAQWLSWLERRPVTAKVESSSLFWVVQDVDHLDKCRSGGTGRRPGLKIPWVVIPVPVRFRSAASDRISESPVNPVFTRSSGIFCVKKDAPSMLVVFYPYLSAIFSNSSKRAIRTFASGTSPSPYSAKIKGIPALEQESASPCVSPT